MALPSAPATADEAFSLRPILVSAFGPALMFGVAEGAVLPVVALTARSLGASLAVASLIVALIGVGSLVTNIPSAMITAKFGERVAIIGAGGTSAAAMVLAMVAPDLFLLAVAMLLVGFANSVFTLARQSYLTEVVPIAMRARALSTLGGSGRIGIFVGPFVGAGAIHIFGIRGAYGVAAIAALIAGGIAIFSRDLIDAQHGTRRHAAVGVRVVLKSHLRVFVTLGLGIILISAVRASRQVVIPLWAEHLGLGASATSLIYGLAGAIDMLVFYPAGKVMDRRGRAWVAIPSMIMMGVSLMLVPLTNGFATLLITSMMLGFANGIGAGMVMTLGADVSPSIGRPAFLGIWRLLSDTGSCGGPVILSAITGVATLAAGVETNGGLGFLAAAILWYWIPRTKRPPLAADTSRDTSSASAAALPAIPASRAEPSTPTLPERVGNV
ncbi:MFS transporter [Jatrophihabitans sp. DSM 45814]